MTDTPMTVADIVDAAANGRMGHVEVMRRLGLRSREDLVETMRLNGRSLWAHRRPAKGVDPATLELLSLACAPARQRPRTR